MQKIVTISAKTRTALGVHTEQTDREESEQWYSTYGNQCVSPVNTISIKSPFESLKQSRYWAGVAHCVPGSKVPRFHENGTGWWYGQPYAPAAFTPRKYTWYSFLLQAESTLGLQYHRKDYVTEKFL
jgi:hypothetical protein